ncbi:ribonuclease E [Pectinophora gossypiella]|nr:ribonuclease E [Pectinophora gossypiella]
MSVIIRLQNLPWSANALDIRNFFRGLSIPEGGVHIVGGELGDAFIAFSTDEDARQAMMLDGGKIKEIQVKLHLSSRSEMHKVIEAARQSVPILTLTAPAAPVPAVVPAPATIPAPVPATIVPPTMPAVPAAPVISPFSAALGNNIGFGIPGIGNPQEIPQPAVIEPPAPLVSPPVITTEESNDNDDKQERKRSKEKDRRRSRSRSRSRDRDRKDRKRDRRDRSRSRERRRRDRSRSRDRRDRKRDRKDRSRSRDRSPSRRSRDRRNKSPQIDKPFEPSGEGLLPPPPPVFGNKIQNAPALIQNNIPNGPAAQIEPNRFSDPTIAEAYNKLQELGKKRNPNAFQGQEQQNGGRMQGARGGGNMARGGMFRREGGRPSRFENNEAQRDCSVAIRNAPNHTSYGDVRRFFPFMIDKHGIKMINDNMGRRTGNIYVRFCDPRSKHLALQRKNNELKGSEVIVESLDDDAYDSAVDSFLPYRDDNGEEHTIDITEPEEKPIPVFTILKLTDLPNFVKEHDIIKIFSDFSLLSIMLNDDRMTRTKVAFVQFAKPEEAKEAFDRKDRYIFGRRHPTIAVCSSEEYEKEKAIQNEKMMGDPRTVRPELREMEPPPQQEPVVPRDPRQRRPQFENGPPQQGSPAQQPQGPAFFGNTPFPQQQFPPQAAFPAPQFGGFPSGGLDPRTAAANWASRPAFPNQMGNMHNHNRPTNDLDNEPLDCVLMKGLPREATDRTIVTFLSDTGAVPARIHLMLDASGMPSGDCFCEFRSVQEARMATTKHGQNLEGCRVTVDLVTRTVVEEALEGPKQPEMRDGILGTGPPPQFYDNNQRGGFVSRGFRGRGGFDRGGYDRGGFRGGYEGRGGGFRGRGGFNDRGRGFDRGRGRGFSRGRGGFENGMGRDRDSMQHQPDESDPALEDFGAPGCVVSMENVPFRASVDDILTFFSEFELTQDDIIRRYNERGQPTGDARVAFRTPFDAQRAVKTRHMDNIHDRRINLTIL